MPAVWSDRVRLHEPGGEVWVGVRTPGTEVPARAERIREALESEGARILEAPPAGADELLGVHDPELLDYLAGSVGGLGNLRAEPRIPARTASSPTSFPTLACSAGSRSATPPRLPPGRGASPTTR